MSPLIQCLQQLEGTSFVREDGDRTNFRLLPPLSAQELSTFSASLPCPLPPEIGELLAFTRGFSGTWLDEVTFARMPRALGFAFDEIFPHAIALANDGLGNYWVIDLTSESEYWGPIFYACHDAPVIVYQADSLLRFVQQVIRGATDPWKSEISDVYGSLSDRIWSDNPGVLSFEHCVQSADHELKAFAGSLDETWQFIDLRNPVLGDGFSWGRYGARTLVKRFGEKRIFAYQRKSAGRRILDALR
jgi:hypothetical protein